MENNTAVPFYDTLPDSDRKKYSRYAICAACFNCFGDLLQDSSAVLILFYLAIGAGNGLTMFQTAVYGIASMLLQIPMSGYGAKTGAKQCIRKSAYIAFVSYILMVLAPCFGGFGKYWALLCFTGYCIARVLWTTGWFPLLTFILKPEERPGFIGTMRFCYSLVIGVVFFLVGIFMKNNTPLWVLQIIILCTGFLTFMRWFCIRKIPAPEKPETVHFELVKGIRESLRNAPLVMYSVYACFVILTAAAISPLVILYAKQYLQLPDGQVQILSTVTLAGNVVGYIFFSRVRKHLGSATLQICCHLFFILIPMTLALTGKHVPQVAWIVGVQLFMCNLVWAFFYAGFSTEMLALAKPGNATISTGICQTYQMLGTAGGRTFVSLMLGANILSAHWNYHGIDISSFQSLFIILAGIALFSLILIPCMPCLIPKHEDYYNP